MSDEASGHRRGSIEEFVGQCVRDLSDTRAENAWHRLIEGGPEVIPAVMGALLSAHDPSVRTKLIQVLSEYRVPDTAFFLGRLLTEKDAEVWKAALDALVTLGGPAAREALQHACETSDAERKSWIVEAIEQLDPGTT